MRLEDLLPAKKIKSVYFTTGRLSQTVQGGNTTRARLVISTSDFNKLYNPGKNGISPRSNIHGNVKTGLIIHLDANGANKVDMQTRNTVYFSWTVRAVGGAENKIAQVPVGLVIVTYEDGSVYLVAPPLPDQFLTTTDRNNRQKIAINPLKVVKQIYDFAGREVPNTLPPAPPTEVLAPHEPETAPTEAVESTAELPAEDTTMAEAAPAEAAPDEAVEKPQAFETVASGAISDEILERFRVGSASVSDIREMLTMLNAEASRLQETGTANIRFKVVDDGKSVRASVSFADIEL